MPQYSVSQYAKLIGKTRWTVYNYVKAKTLPKGAKAKMCCGKMVIEVKPKKSLGSVYADDFVTVEIWDKPLAEMKQK